MNRLTLALDVMGGDIGPRITIPASLSALEADPMLSLVLFGDSQQISPLLENAPSSLLERIQIHHCTKTIDNNQGISHALRHSKGTSMRLAIEMIQKGEAQGCVSAGNTGAITVGATLLTKRIKGVKRPAIASVMPSAKKPFVLMDCGANAECRPEFLYQFGLLGSIYMQNVLKVSNPRVALANNGTEETKGTPVVKEAYALMKSAPYNFVGNIEGRQIPFGDADVVVADGFTGNLILKMYEGVAKVLMNSIKAAFMKNTLSKISYLGVKSGIDDMKKQFDYKEYGGAVVLGVKKPVIKAHGSADARTFKNAIKQAVWFLQTDLIDKIEKELND